MSVNQESGEIVWSVGNEVLNSAQYDKIKDKDIDWVPYIRLCDKGDKMEILLDHEKSKEIAKAIFKSWSKWENRKEKVRILLSKSLINDFDLLKNWKYLNLLKLPKS